MTIHASGSVVDVDSSGTTTGGRASLDKDQIFHVLQNERRRLILRYLADRDGQVRMRDVAEQVAAWEHDTTVEQLTSKQRQRVYIPLYQNHLPKLDELGIIEYNQSRGVVERRPLADQLTPYLDPFASEGEAVSDESFPWELPYLGVASFGTLLVAGKGLHLSVLGTLPALLLGAMVILLFTATSGVQLVTERYLDT